jgi:hypothetical protein
MCCSMSNLVTSYFLCNLIAYYFYVLFVYSYLMSDMWCTMSNLVASFLCNLIVYYFYVTFVYSYLMSLPNRLDIPFCPVCLLG